MKKILLAVLMATSIVGMSSCSIDDSNDIEIIKPMDTVITGTTAPKKPL